MSEGGSEGEGVCVCEREGLCVCGVGRVCVCVCASERVSE